MPRYLRRLEELLNRYKVRIDLSGLMFLAASLSGWKAPDEVPPSAVLKPGRKSALPEVAPLPGPGLV